MVDIRKARLKDIDRIAGMWNDFMKEHREMGIKWKEDRIPEVRENAVEMVRSYYSTCIRSKNSLLLVLEDDDEVRGFMLSVIRKNVPIFKGGPVGFIDTIHINRSYRGRGFSSRLFDETMKWFNEKGVTEVSIRVMCCNEHAYKVYEKWGFKDIHVEKRLDLF